MNKLYIGILSGTSMDNIDAAIVSFTENKIQVHATYTHPIDPDTKRQYIDMIKSQTVSLSLLSEFDSKLGEMFAEAVNKLLKNSSVSSEEITAIGLHGQTIWHQPTGLFPNTLQVGNANILSVKTNIKTYSDFRRKDLALGGQGAPLAPAFHAKFFSKPNQTDAIINIGGISNISIVKDNNDLYGFDTGPGNCLLDTVSQEYFNCDYDHNGKIAASGTCIYDLFYQLISDSYFQKIPPKSSGREYFNSKWLEPYIKPTYEPKDILATLVELTAESIAQEIFRYNNSNHEKIKTLYICGGGIKNSYLIKRIQMRLDEIPVKSSEEVGVDPMWVEAALFAWLAKLGDKKEKLKISRSSGACMDVSPGVLYN